MSIFGLISVSEQALTGGAKIAVLRALSLSIVENACEYLLRPQSARIYSLQLLVWVNLHWNWRGGLRNPQHQALYT